MAADLRLVYAVTSTGKHSPALTYKADTVSSIYALMSAIVTDPGLVNKTKNIL